LLTKVGTKEELAFFTHDYEPDRAFLSLFSLKEAAFKAANPQARVLKELQLCSVRSCSMPTHESGIVDNECRESITYTKAVLQVGQVVLEGLVYQFAHHLVSVVLRRRSLEEDSS
jgi:4'-phosphopantetheinyl transferase EntD